MTGLGGEGIATATIWALLVVLLDPNIGGDACGRQKCRQRMIYKNTKCRIDLQSISEEM